MLPLKEQKKLLVSPSFRAWTFQIHMFLFPIRFFITTFWLDVIFSKIRVLLPLQIMCNMSDETGLTISMGTRVGGSKKIRYRSSNVKTTTCCVWSRSTHTAAHRCQQYGIWCPTYTEPWNSAEGRHIFQ